MNIELSTLHTNIISVVSRCAKFSVTHLMHSIFVLNSNSYIGVSILNYASITAILWRNSDIETSDSLDRVVGGVGDVSFDAKGLVVVLKFLPLWVGIVGADDVFGGSLEGITTVTEIFTFTIVICQWFVTIFQLFFTQCLLC